MTFNRGWKNRADYYATKKIDFHGRSFASQLEASLYGYLLQLVQAGEQQELTCQPQCLIGPPGTTRSECQLMIPDFRTYELATKHHVFWEAKGFEDEKWKYKRKIWLWHGPGPMRIFKGSARSFKMVEELVPQGLR
jgi:hypothetical protein